MIELVPVTASHASLFLAWRRESRTLKYNPVRPSTEEELAVRLSKCGFDLSKWDHEEYRWIACRGGERVGTVSLSGISREMGYAELGYMLGESFQGQGLGTQVIRYAVEMIFQRSPLRRLIACTSKDNVASWRLLERLGFKREGALRDHYLIGAKPTTQFLYGLLRAEWHQDPK